MKYKKIVGFGDSWMWGDELFDPSLHGIENPHPVNTMEYLQKILVYQVAAYKVQYGHIFGG